MQKKYQHLILFLLCVWALTACNRELLDIKTVANPSAPVLSTSLDDSPFHAITILPQDSANAVLSIHWTEAQYLADTSQGKLALSYILQFDTSSDFINPASIVFFGNVLDTVFTGAHLNNFLLGSVGCTAGEVNNIYIRIKATQKIDTLTSNVYAVAATPYEVMLPLKIPIPSDGLFVIGNATTASWNYANIIPMTKKDYHTYTVSLLLTGGETYSVLGNATGNPWLAYALPGGVNASGFTMGGSFIENSAAAGWPATTDLLSPAATGTYTLTFDFLTATFTVHP